MLYHQGSLLPVGGMYISKNNRLIKERMNPSNSIFCPKFHITTIIDFKNKNRASELCFSIFRKILIKLLQLNCKQFNFTQKKQLHESAQVRKPALLPFYAISRQITALYRPLLEPLDLDIIPQYLVVASVKGNTKICL